MPVTCDYCHRDAKLVTGRVLYPHRPDLWHRRFWHCSPCGAFVGCHQRGKNGDGTRPLGRLANAELRRWKRRAHDAFDPLWRTRTMTRQEAYSWLSKTLGVSAANCHIGMFDVDGCRAVIAAVDQLRSPAR